MRGALGLGAQALLLALAVEGVAAELPEESCDQSPDEGLGTPAHALLQHRTRDHTMDPTEERGRAGDAEAAAGLGANISAKSWASSLLSDGVVGPASVQVFEGGRALVGFLHAGKAMEYQLRIFSVFAEGAGYWAHTDAGAERRPLPPAHTFQARDEDNEHGLWASVSIDDDGLVTGLFEVEDGVVRLEPLEGARRARGGAALPQAAQVAEGTGVQAPHLKQRLDIAGFWRGDAQGGPREGPSAGEGLISLGRGDWKGTKWWPGCYAGDEKLSVFRVGLVFDQGLTQMFGGQAAELMQQTVASASFIFEHQLHVKLVVGHVLDFQGAQATVPDFARCKPKRPLLDRFRELGKWLPSGKHTMPTDLGAFALFSGCPASGSAGGWATTGAVCTGGHLALSSTKMMQKYDYGVWAHEMGHIFGAGHTFDSPTGARGGIMDNDPWMPLQGEEQMNTVAHKQEVCRAINEKRHLCNKGTFEPADGSPAPAPHTPAAPHATAAPHTPATPHTTAGPRTPARTTPPPCRDDPFWRDRHYFHCHHWQGRDCHRQQWWWWHYSMSNLAQVRQKCKQACMECR